MRGDPRVHRGERFFEQRQALESNVACRFNRQFPGFLVEGRGNRENDRLPLQSLRLVIARVLVIPTVSEVRKQASRGIDG